VQCLQGFHTWSSCYMWSWTASTQHLYTAAPDTADDEKLGGAWNEARVWANVVVRTSRARATSVAEQWVSDLSVQANTHNTSGHTYTCSAQGMMQIRIPSAMLWMTFWKQLYCVAVNHRNSNVLTVVHLLVPWSCSWSEFQATSTWWRHLVAVVYYLSPSLGYYRVVPPLHALVGFTSCHKYGLSSFLLWYTRPQKCPLLLREQLANVYLFSIDIVFTQCSL